MLLRKQSYGWALVAGGFGDSIADVLQNNRVWPQGISLLFNPRHIDIEHGEAWSIWTIHMDKSIVKGSVYEK